MAVGRVGLSQHRATRLGWLFGALGLGLAGFELARLVPRFAAPAPMRNDPLTDAVLSLLAVAAIVAANVIGRRGAGGASERRLRDPETGLLSAQHAEALLAPLRARDDRSGDSRIALVLLRVDLFDQYRTRYGAAAVAEIMQTVGELVRQQTRVGDLPLRFADNGLAVYLQCVDLGQAQALGRRITMLLSQRQFAFGGEQVKVGLDIAAVMREPGESLAVLQRRAAARLDGPSNAP